jgi:UDP-sulfoquinovose synthase
MRFLVLGGDGFLGWPTALHLSAKGHEVAVLDNLCRRRWDVELDLDSLVPIYSLPQRVQAWKEVSGKEIKVYVADLMNYEELAAAVSEFQPEGIVHYAEQASAPFSMMNRQRTIFTQTNNVIGTLNLAYAINDIVPDCHLVKLGTMGEYGTPNIDIEEGFIKIEHNGRSDILPFPKSPGSFYHLSKVHDSHNLEFVCKIWGMRVTDLNQGVVYGVETAETKRDPRLETRYNYDSVFGTVLNRYCVEAAIGHPLTVYGKGGQTRGFINVQDTVRCIELALLNPANPGEFRVFNQITESFNVKELAETVQKCGDELGWKVEIHNIPNPRVEKEEHYYNPKHTKLLELGLEPHLLSDTLINSVLHKVKKYAHRVDKDKIPPRIQWRRNK